MYLSVTKHNGINLKTQQTEPEINPYNHIVYTKFSLKQTEYINPLHFRDLMQNLECMCLEQSQVLRITRQ